MISQRLLKILDFVTPGSKVVDIGCDHGYLVIELINRGIISCALATDINEGPLNNAKYNIKQNNLENQIETRLSNGLNQVLRYEGDCLVIAGMGGGTIIDILTRGEVTASSFKEIIIEPQSEIYKVRKFLYDNDYLIIDEDMVCESNKYYPIIKLVKNSSTVSTDLKRIKFKHITNLIFELNDLSDTELLYGPYLLSNKDLMLYEYLIKELERLTDVKNKLRSDSTNDIDNLLKITNNALEYYKE